ncbi:MAG: bile acid:sodium symporter [Cyanobacteria bacterium J06648_10]
MALTDLPLSIKIVIYLFLFTFMFSVAMETARAELITNLKSGLMARSLLINFILLPFTGMFLIWLFHLPTEFSIGFLIVASVSGGVLSLHYVHIAKGNLKYAVELVSLLSILSIVVSPLLINLILPDYVSIRLPVFSLMGLLFLLIFPPLLIGQLIKHYYSNKITSLLQRVASFSSTALFIIFTILTSTLQSLDVKALGLNGVAAIVTFNLAGWGISWWLSGADLENRKALAISSSMRNIAVCAAIANMSALGPQAELAIIGFNEITTPMNLVFAIAISRIH